MLPQCSLLVRSSGIESAHGQSVASERFTAHWDGFIYNDDGHAQHRAVNDCLTRLGQGVPAATLLAPLRGSFFLAIHDRQTATSYACVDDSGLFSAYRGPSAASRSFIDLARLEPASIRAAPDPLAMAEFLQLGHLCFRKTLHPSIRKIDFDELVVIDPHGLRVEHKPSARLTDPPELHDLLDASAPLAAALQDQNVSIDLTGGFDSRLLACLFTEHGVPFESGLTSYEGHPDQRLGSQVASALGVPFHYTAYDPGSIVDDLPALLQRSDALCGNLGTCHRLLKYCEDRYSRGITVSLKGQGGEMFKDFFWTQDLPFYRRQKSRLALLHRLRIEMELLTPTVLTDDFHASFLRSREQRLQRLEQYVLPLNTQTYDNIYFRERIQSWNARTITSSQYAQLPSHSPLCEVGLTRIGFVQPRRKRFYARMHRHYITRASEAAARIATTDNVSAHASWAAMLGDSFGYTRHKLSKLSKKVGQYTLNRTLEARGSRDVNMGAVDSLSASESGQNALQTLKDFGIVRESIGFDAISPRFRSNFLVLGWYLSQCTQTDTDTDTITITGTGTGTGTGKSTTTATATSETG